MTRSNVGSAAPKGRVSLRADMEAFDNLPPEVRGRLRSMTENWNATGAEKIIRTRGVTACLAVLSKVEGDVQAALQERLAA